MDHVGCWFLTSSGESCLMIAENEATVIFPPSPSLIPLQTRALPVCHMCDTVSRHRAGCSSERVSSNGSRCEYWSDVKCTDISSNFLLQTGLSHNFASGGFCNCLASCAVESRGRGQRHQSLTDHSSASLHWQRGLKKKEEAETQIQMDKQSAQNRSRCGHSCRQTDRRTNGNGGACNILLLFLPSNTC